MAQSKFSTSLGFEIFPTTTIDGAEDHPLPVRQLRNRLLATGLCSKSKFLDFSGACLWKRTKFDLHRALEMTEPLSTEGD